MGRLKQILTTELTIPDWYYKKDLELSQKMCLRKSILKYDYGYLTTYGDRDNRKILDGVRRYKILQEEKVTGIYINHIDADDDQAFLLSKNMNDFLLTDRIAIFNNIDIFKFCEVLKDIGKRKGIKYISNIIIESDKEVEYLIKLLEFDWEQFKKKERMLFDL